MADVKRWSVTHTKHMRQKRKVYQDGFLEHHTSTNKLLLYDDGEKLLECRVLKKDEVISCGETLTFKSFLVDINGPDGDHELRPNSNSIGRNGRNEEKNRSRRLNLSPSQKIIRDFKKREVLKYEAIHSKSPDTTKSSITEWEVMYTTQITQKAKKYHDGFVQLALRGSIGRQLVLLDERRNNLDSRFLKMDEKIESGATISFDAHLVEIGEPRGDHKSSGENSSNVMRETGIVHGQQNYAHRNDTVKTVKQEFVKNGFLLSGASHNSQHTTESSPTEWKVLYTAQLTQKSKKYHDGFLKLTICGSRGRQAMLYDETRKLLNSGFLKREEVIRTGVSFVFDAYLVEIGEREGNNEPLADLTAEGNSCNVVKETGKMHEQQNSLTSNKYVLKGKPPSNAWLRRPVESDFNISSSIGKKESSRTAPLRDAHQILSFLQKPRTQKGMPADSTNSNMTTKKGPLVSNAADLDFPEDDKAPKLSVAHEKSSESMDARESRESIDIERPVDIMPSEARSTGNGCQLVKGDNGNSHQQLNSNKMEVESRWCDGENASHMPSSTTASCGPVVDEKNHPEDHLTCAWEMDDCPSFDLGI